VRVLRGDVQRADEGEAMSGELRAPFPWFGGKRRAASRVWAALGNVDHYVEPFAGSAAVLLARPHVGRCETINDADGMVSNFWRAVRSQPDAVAAHADWPVVEADLHARHLWLIGQRESLTERLVADPEWCDAKVAGWWVWGICAWIGSGWCDAKPSRKLPHLGDEGMGVHAPRRGAAFSDDAVAFASPAEWFRALSERLRAVRIASGDWRRVVASETTLYPAGRGDAKYRCGVYLDPPYLDGRMDYAAGGAGTSLSADVRAWALQHGADKRLRIVLSGYAGEHDALEAHGWRVEAWKARGGYGGQRVGEENVNRKRERLWLSPACLGDEALPLFGGVR
jgi:site-specific DNA-adenine methylase